MDTASGDDETPPTPEESLRFIEEQRAATIRAVEPDLLLYYGPWGVAWLVGFGLFFLSHGLHDEPYVEMPAGLPLVVLYVLMAAAIAATVYASARAARGVKGPSTTQAAMYGWAWPLGFAGVIALAVRFGEGLPGPERRLLWSGLSGLETSRPAGCPGGRSAGSSWPSPSPDGRTWSSSTSQRPGWTSRHVTRSGTGSGRFTRKAGPW